MSVPNNVTLSEERWTSKNSSGRPCSPPKHIPTPFASYPSTPIATAPLANNFVYTKHKSPTSQNSRLSEKLRRNAFDGGGKSEKPGGLPKLKDRRKLEKAERFLSRSRSASRSPTRSEAAFQSAFPAPSTSHAKLVQAKNDFEYPSSDRDDTHLPDSGHSNDPAENYTRSTKLREEYEQAMVEKALRTKQNQMRHAEDRRSMLTKEVQREIEEFEHRNAKEMGLDDDDDMDKEENATSRPSTQDKLGPEAIKSFLALQSTLEPVEHIKALQRKLPSSKATKLQCKEYTEKIKEKKIEEEMARKEREQRQRKMILDQQNAQKLLEEANREEHLLRKLMRQSQQERRIAQQLMNVRHEKEIVRNNRLFREKQYQECRQRDYEKALEREAQICAQARLEFQRQTDLQSKQYKAVLDQKAERKKKNHFAMCSELTRQLIDLALRMSDYSNLNDGMVPPKILREWKMLFQAGRPLTEDSHYSIQHDWIEASGVILEPGAPGAGGILEGDAEKMNEETLEGIKLLDDEEFSDYLTGKGDWTMTEGETPIQGANETLGRVVSTILDLTSQVDATSGTPALPAVPLQLSIIGKRFSGKSTLAEQLAGTYSLTVLVMDVLISEAISAHETNEVVRSLHGADAKAAKRNLHSTPGGNPHQGITSTKHASRPVPSPRAQLGGKIQMAMLEGGSPDDSLLVALAVEAIKEVGAQRKAGWVLVDFPRNKIQAQLLEKELSGYEDPKPVKPGGLKRQTVKEKLPLSSKKKSLIAPTRNDGEETPSSQPVSGIDQVIYLEIDNDLAFKRSAGRRIDPLTGEMYNFDTAPPPKNIPGLNERLVALEDEGGKDTQIQYQLATFEDQIDPLCEWYSRFQNMKTIAGTLPSSQVTEKANVYIQDIVSRKEKSREEKTQEANAKEKEHTGSKTEIGKLETEVTESPPNNEADVAGGATPIQVAATTERKTPTVDTPKVESEKSDRKRGPSAKGNAKDAEKNRTLSASFGQKEKDKSTRNLASEAPTKEKRNPSAGREKRPITTGAPTESAIFKEEPPPTPVPPIVRPLSVDGRKLPSKDLAEILADQWATIETSFTETIKFSFRSLRKERDDALHHFHGLKESFHKFLERPDQKQEFVEVFQRLYNEMENDLRSDPDAKAELHQRVEDLRDKLWEISDQRKEEAEAERQSHIDDRWVEDHYANINNVYITMMQAEVDRYIGTKQVLTDFFKDSNAETIDENPPPSVVIPMISAQSLPESIIGLGGAPADSMRGNRPIAPNSAGGTNQGKKGATGGQNSHGKKVLAKTSSDRHIQAIPTTDHGITESDLEKFAEIQAVFEAAVAVTYPPKEMTEKEVNEKSTKKKTASVVEAVVESKETEPDVPVECIKAIEVENQILRKRLERIRRQGIEHLKELANKGLEVFNILDDCIGLRFQSEMDAIKDLVNVIREAIESEIKLPNELVLEGEKFQVDYRVLTYEPEPEPRPESPVEKQTPDGFTVLQLLNLGQQFRDCAPSGSIPSKDFIEGIQRLAVFTIGLDVLPESWMSTDQTQLNQLAATFDPYGTGNVNWKSFLLTAAKLLPVSLADVQQTRDSYRNAPSWNNGTISKRDFMRVPLWFEQSPNMNDPPSQTDDPTSKFNRPAKMKSALFHLFAQPVPSTMTDSKLATSAASPEKSEESTDAIGSKPNQTANSLGNGVPLLAEHGVLNNEDWLFDVTDFLLSLCLDEQPKLGVQKAFIAGNTDKDEGALSALQLYRVFHHGLSLVSETHRLTGDANAEDPFPMEILQKIVDESGDNGMITFDAFSRATEGQPDFLNCPLYQMEEIAVGKALG